MLLRFVVRNFRCFADEVELNLVTPQLKTNVPRPGQSWTQCTERVAAIYGPNAAGKSSFLEAIWALAWAVRSPGAHSVYQPYAADTENEPVAYVVDFVSGGTRYAYEVEVAEWGVAREELASYPKGSRRLLFSRSQADPDEKMAFTKGASLTGPTGEVRRITRPHMLFLATAHAYGHEQLAPVARTLMASVGIDLLSFRERLDEQVLHRVVMEMVAAPEEQVNLVGALLQAADLGVESLEVRTEEVTADERERVIRLLKALDEGDEIDEERIPRLREVVTFQHCGADGVMFGLPLRAQSSGTITWLTTVWHALDALRQGSLLLIDELDASLHPALARYIVSMFLNPELNRQGAQLVFSSHDVSLLSNAPSRLLEPSQVWFVEKDGCSRSELYSQQDFDNRAGNNSERRYLAGKFGAVPDIDESLLMRYVDSQLGPGEDDDQG